VGEASSRSHDCAVEGSPDDHVTLVLIHGATVSFCCGAKSGKDKGGWRGFFLCVKLNGIELSPLTFYLWPGN